MSFEKGIIHAVILENRCKGCELCIAVCPVKILYLSDKLNVIGCKTVAVSDVTKCIACRRCALICPDVAIEVKAGR